jgi:putative transposase
MKNHSSEFSVEKMAVVLEVSRSGYYAFAQRPQGLRSAERMQFDLEVSSAYSAGKQRYGSEKVRQELGRRGRKVSRKRVAESMRRQGLYYKPKRRYKVTTDSRHSFPVAENLLQRNFSVGMPNRVWVSDITYVSSNSGWLYLTVFIDLFSRLVVGWYISTSLGHEGVLTALRRAVWRRKPQAGLLIHSDRGAQYCCHAFRREVETLRFVQSMSRKGDCWDNAVAESFFRTLKTELVYRNEIRDRVHAEELLFEYIEVFYNRQRLHATLGYVPPAEFETVALKKCA